MKINLSAPINKLGYGVVGTNVALALEANECEVSLWPIGPIQNDPKYTGTIQKMVDRQENYDIMAHSLRLWHQHDLAQHVGSNLRIGWPIFELNKFTTREKNHLKACDRLFVCSKWAKQVIENNRICVPTHVVPLGIDNNIFNEHKKPINGSTTVFLMCGKWEKRKGHDFVLQAFEKAFSSSDNVKLMVMCSNPFLKPEQEAGWHKLIFNNKLSSKIQLISRQTNQEDVAIIMSQADCGLFLSRAEGWNLELLEMMSIGKPVIATNYSGHTEFCNKENCLLIDVDKLEDAEDEMWFYKQGEWAYLGDLQMEQTVAYMRWVHQRKGELLNVHGIATGHRLNWNNTAKTIMEYLR